MEAEIRALGREHLRTHGAAGLSLRAIARDLGVVSSAVYRYVPSRDDLLTLLLVEGYTDLADAVDAAASAVPPAAHEDRILVGAHALRAWAVADPARWALLYGSPVPGYAAPPEATVEPGTRVIAFLLTEIAGADAAGALRADAAATDPAPGVHADLAAIRTEFGIDCSDAATAMAALLWATMIGAVSLEVFGQYGPDTFTDPKALFDLQMRCALSAVFA
ncbi:TetR/AcrR family transcriptional regulator [Gordonia sinesedis]